jgi:hypothetical protein
LSPGKILGIPRRLAGCFFQALEEDPLAARLDSMPRTATESPAAVCFLFDTALFPVSGLPLPSKKAA